MDPTLIIHILRIFWAVNDVFIYTWYVFAKHTNATKRTHTVKEEKKEKKTKEKTHRPNKTKSEEWAHENKRFELEHAKRENEKKNYYEKKTKQQISLDTIRVF